MNNSYILNLLFPKRCPVCDCALPFFDSDTGICKTCMKTLPVIRKRRCFMCGRKMGDLSAEYCMDCRKTKEFHAYDKGMAFCEYDDVMRTTIYRLKYGNRCEYAKTLGNMMGLSFKRFFVMNQIQGIIAIPLHQKRQKKRGYNQAELLAKAISETSGIPYFKNYVVRVKNTAPLKMMDPSERQNNLKKAFKIGRNDVKLKIIIVIDDIYTTGSTIDAVSRVLKESGVQKVFFLTLAIGMDLAK